MRRLLSAVLTLGVIFCASIYPVASILLYYSWAVHSLH